VALASRKKKVVLKGKKGLCVIGCTPYVDVNDDSKGYGKYKKLVADMADNCDIMVHVGDTKAGAAVCNATIMANPVLDMIEEGKRTGIPVLYAPGDNELNDCHRDGSRVPPRPADYYKAADARQFLIDTFGVNEQGSNGKNQDLTAQFSVLSQKLPGKIPGTDQDYSCDFHKFIKFKNFGVATLEVLGSYWYLADQSQSASYPNQDSVDPLADRLAMYYNAKDCALAWITRTTKIAKKKGLRGIAFNFHARFWTAGTSARVDTFMSAEGRIGEYYNSTNLGMMTKDITGEEITEPFQPLYEHLTQTAYENPDLMFYVVNADSHTWANVRMNGGVTNANGEIVTYHNLMIGMVEGDSRAVTQYAKFTFDEDAFQPSNMAQIWSKEAYDYEPAGHTFYKYS